jgi:predicted ATPase
MIRRVRVTNFKSLNDVVLEPSQQNVLVGPNMSGKTNFISLFKFLRLMVAPTGGGPGLPQAITALGGFADLVWRGGESNVVSIELAGDFSPTEAWNYRLEFAGAPYGAINVQDETLVLRGSGGEVELIRKNETGQRVLSGRTHGQVSQIHDTSRSALEYEIPDWEGNKLRQLLASMRFYALIPQRIKTVNTTAMAPALDEDGGNLSAWLLLLQTRFQEHFNKINLAAKGALPDIASVFTFPTQQSTVFIASKERHLKTAVPLWQMSDGELCFIALLSLIFAPPELTALTYFIEEPENHLHPQLIDVLTGLLEQARVAAPPDPAQLFITTHSLEVVDRSRLEDLIVFEKRNGATVCTRPVEKQHLHELLSRRELGLGSLYYSGALGRD